MAGRSTGYSGKAVRKSITFDPELLRELEAISGGNLSQTVNELLSEKIKFKRREYHADRLGEIWGIEPDPELDQQIDERIDKFFDELTARVAKRRAERAAREEHAARAKRAG